MNLASLRLAARTVQATITSQDLLLLLPLVVISLILTIWALVDLVRRERVRGGKALWALVIVIIGTVGPLAYFLFGRVDE